MSQHLLRPFQLVILNTEGLALLVQVTSLGLLVLKVSHNFPHFQYAQEVLEWDGWDQNL